PSTDGIAASDSPSPPPLEGVSADVLHEREIIRILLHYGGHPATWEDSELPIAPLLLSGLNDVSFDDPTCLAIIAIYREFISRNQLPDERTFIGHHDRAI